MNPTRPTALELRWTWGDLLLDTQHRLPSDGPVTASAEPRWTWRVLGVPLGSVSGLWRTLARFVPPVLSDVEVDTAPGFGTSIYGAEPLFAWTDDDGVVAHHPDGSSTLLTRGQSVCLTADGVTLTARVVDAPRGLVQRASDDVDYPFVASLCLTGFVAGLASVMLWSAPPPLELHATAAMDTFTEHMVQLQQPPEPEPVVAATEPSAESGAAAPEPEGRTGKREALKDDAAAGVSERQADNEIVRQAGVLAAWGALGMDTLGENLLGGDLAGSIGSLTGPRGVALGNGLGRFHGGPGGGGQTEGLGGWGPRGGGAGGDPFGSHSGCADCPGKGDGSISSFAEPVIIGHIDRSLIHDVVTRHLTELRYCYQRQLQRTPGLSGKVVVQFTIANDGTVSRAATKESTLQDADVESCINGRFMRMSFPDLGGVAVVSYPFLFAPQ